MLSWGFCMLLHHWRGRSEDHHHKQPSAAKIVLTCPSCQVLLPGYVPFLHPFHTADLTWEVHSLREHLGGILMRKTGRKAGWEGVAWAEQDTAVRRKEGDKAAQRTEQSPPITSRILLHLQTGDKHRGKQLKAKGSQELGICGCLWWQSYECCILGCVGPVILFLGIAYHNSHAAH